MTPSIKTIADDSDLAIAQDALNQARKSFADAEATERMWKAACDGDRQRWLDSLTHSPVASHRPLFECFERTAVTWHHAREQLAAARQRVAECEVDVVTALRSDPTPCPQCHEAGEHKAGCERGTEP